MGQPKALLDYRGETFVGRLIRVFGKFCDPVVVVLGHNADALREQIRANIVVNPDPERGQLSSLQTALAAIDSDFLFSPVDCPTVQEETVETLVHALRALPPASLPGLAEFVAVKAPPVMAGAAGDRVVIPRYRGKRGHPVCVSRSLIPEFLALPPTAETRAAIDAHPDRITYLDVDDPGILADIDDAEAYRKIATIREGAFEQ